MSQSLLQFFESFVKHLSELGISFDRTGLIWIVIQIAIITASIYASRYIGKKLINIIEPKLRQIHGKPGLLRFLVLILRRLPTLVFCLLIWLAVVFLKAITWPSHSFTLMIVLSLVSAWVFIDIASRTIRNKLISKPLGLAIWGIVALNVLKILPEVVEVLSNISIDIGNLHLSLLDFVKGTAVMFAGMWIALSVAKITERRLDRSAELTPSLKVLTSKLLKALFVCVALVIGLKAIGIDFTALAVLSGAIGLGIGFGLQKIISNLISGIILLMDKSIKPGDVISVGDTFGRINSLGSRYVSVVARDGREYLIPNEDLITNQVLNWSFSSELVRLDLNFGTSYDSDPYLVRELARQCAAQHPRVVIKQKPVCHIVEFGDSSIDYLLRFWIRDPSNGVTNVKGDIYLLLWKAFKDNEIIIPFPHREVIVHNSGTVPGH